MMEAMVGFWVDVDFVAGVSAAMCESVPVISERVLLSYEAMIYWQQWRSLNMLSTGEIVVRDAGWAEVTATVWDRQETRETGKRSLADESFRDQQLCFCLLRE